MPDIPCPGGRGWVPTPRSHVHPPEVPYPRGWLPTPQGPMLGVGGEYPPPAHILPAHARADLVPQMPTPIPPEQTDTCENITFPQLRLAGAKNTNMIKTLAHFGWHSAEVVMPTFSAYHTMHYIVGFPQRLVAPTELVMTAFSIIYLID